jgi:hypothetical protein
VNLQNLSAAHLLDPLCRGAQFKPARDKGTPINHVSTLTGQALIMPQAMVGIRPPAERG